MDEAGLAEVAGIVGAGGAALAVLAGRRASLLAGFGLLAFAEALLAVSIAGTEVLDKAASPAAVGAGAGGLVVVALAAAVFVRFPLLTIPALVVAAPFRPPVDFDREYRLFFALAEGGRLGRLIPLYAVLTASAAADRRADSGVPGVRLPIPAVVARHRGGSEPARVLPPPLRRARRDRRTGRPGSVATARAGGDRDRPRVRLRGRRPLAAGDEGAPLLRAGARGRQRLLPVLPRDLGLHRSQPVRRARRPRVRGPPRRALRGQDRPRQRRGADGV